MVKRQKEKQYLSSREQREQGRSRSNLHHGDSSLGVVQKALPFKCCALSLVPFETPVCTISELNEASQSKKHNQRYGIVFDNNALMDFVFKHKRDPVTGKPLQTKQIIQLEMDQDSETNDWQCPVLTKPFSDHTKIVAVISPPKGNTAYVYSYEAYKELCLKTKNYVDLTTGLKFHPQKDVLILNDPNDNPGFAKLRDVSNFWHIRNARQTGSNATAAAAAKNTNIRQTVTSTRVMEQLQKDRMEREKQKAIQEAAAAQQKSSNDKGNGGESFEVPGSNLPFEIPSEDVTGVKYSSGSAASGLTSTSSYTASEYINKNNSSSRPATPREILQSRCNLLKSKTFKDKKGYVNLLVEIRRPRKNSTKQAPLLFPLLLELHCDLVPLTCINFFGLCRKQTYDGTIFHRLIDGFMIQGGGEKGRTKSKTKKNTTTAGNSRDACLWGYDGFRDEFDDRLKHTDGGGVLAMANAGPNTNKQQFYITLDKACPHLDRKHSVFGTVAKGFEEFAKALTKEVVTDAKDRPFLEELDLTNGETTRAHSVVVILATEILEDPTLEAQQFEDQRLTELHNLREAAAADKKRKFMGGSSSSSEASSKPKKEKQESRASTLGVGKYLKAFRQTPAAAATEAPPIMANHNDAAKSSSSSIGIPDFGAMPLAKPAKKKTKFGNFSSW